MTQRKKRILTVTLLLVVAAVIFVFYYFLSIYKGLEGLNKTPANSSFIKVSTDNAEALEARSGREPSLSTFC